MHGSNFSAAVSAMRAISSARSAVTIPLSGSASESAGNDFGCIEGSGNPAHGSAADRRASWTVSATKSPSESRSSSAVDEVAEDCSQKTRSPSRRSRELLSFSTSPRRTPAVGDSAVTHRTSAALAPLRRASSSAQPASSISTVAIRLFPSSLSGARAADRYAVDSNRRQTHAHRHRLAVLAAGPDAGVEREVVADHRDASQYVGAIADKRGAFDGARHPAVLDQVGLARGEHKFAVGDIDLSAAEADCVQAVLDRLYYFLGRGFAVEHEGVGHSGHRRMRKALAPAVAGGRHLHEPRVHAILEIAAQDSLFDQHGARSGRAFVINVQAAAPIGDGAVVDHRAKFARYLLADSIREGRHALAVEVAFQPWPIAS